MLVSGFNFVALEISIFVVFWSNFVKEITNLHIFSLSFGYSVWRCVHADLAPTEDVTMTD